MGSIFWALLLSDVQNECSWKVWLETWAIDQLQGIVITKNLDGTKAVIE